MRSEVISLTFYAILTVLIRETRGFKVQRYSNVMLHVFP